MIPEAKKRCAIYTRVSTDERLGQAFNSLDAQREAAEAYVRSQAGEGWVLVDDQFDDGGFTGGNMQRPALRRLLAAIEAGEIDVVLTYKVDRLSRSLADFTRLTELFDKHDVAYVSITQRIDTSSSMGRLMMNVLQSFAQFEREMVSERTRDKIAATRRKGKWCGGRPILGYDVDRSGGSPRLVVNEDEAIRVRQIFDLYLEHGSLMPVVGWLNDRGWRTKAWTVQKGHETGGKPFDKCGLFNLLTNRTLIGKMTYKDEVHEGEHDAIISMGVWNKVQSRLQRNGKTGGAAARNKYGALLRGLLRCGPCGCSMTHTYTSKGSKRYRYYACSKAQKHGWQSCPAPSLSAVEIEQHVVEQIRCVGQDPTLIAETIEEAGRQAQEGLARLGDEQAVLDRELQRNHEALKRSTDADYLTELHQRIRANGRRLREVQTEIDSLRDGIVAEDDIRAALADFDHLWAALSPKEQVRVLELLIERVVYDGAAGTVTVTFRPTGIRALTERTTSHADARHCA